VQLERPQVDDARVRRWDEGEETHEPELVNQVREPVSDTLFSPRVRAASENLVNQVQRANLVVWWEEPGFDGFPNLVLEFRTAAASEKLVNQVQKANLVASL
jgi:hypothetical protein